MDEQDELIDRVSARLRILPEVDESAKARLLIAVAAARVRDRESVIRRRRWARQLRWGGTGALAAAALIAIVYVSSGPQQRSAPVAMPAASASATSRPAQMAGNDPAALEMAPQPVQFVFRSPDAATVNVVGDFNTWEKAPMVRDSASGLWSATLMIRPGRHVYAFVVNDSIWTRDPRAVAAPDADFGRPGSVLLVDRQATAATR